MDEHMKKLLLNLYLLVGSLSISVFLPAKAAELLIAEVHPITGPAAFYGLPMSQAIQLAVEQINASGGIKAGGEVYRLRLISGDTQASPTIGVAALRKVIGESRKPSSGWAEMKAENTSLALCQLSTVRVSSAVASTV